MRVLIYSNAFAPVVGGVETYVMLLAKGLASESSASLPIEVTLATRSAANGYDDSQHSFRIVRAPSFLGLAKLIRESNVIQIAGPCFTPMAIAWLVGKPFVVEHHGYQASCPNGLLLREPMKEICPGYFMQGSYGKCVSCVAAERGTANGIAQFISTFPRRWLCNRASANTAISQNVSRRLSLPRTRVIYYGIAPAASVETQNEKTRAPQRPLTFGYIGRLVSEKGLPTLIEAASILAKENFDFRLTFIGDGPQRAILEAQVDRSNLRSRTTFTGFLTGSDFSTAAAALDAVVMPSIWEETFGLSALEHMAIGRLVIAADIGGLAEVVDDAGLKFPSGDAAALAQQLRRVFTSPSIIEEYKPKAQQRAKFFSLQKMIDEHTALYNELAAK